MAAHTLDHSAEPSLHPYTERPERLPQAGKVGGPADDPARTDTDHERSCEPVLAYQFPVSGLRHMTRAALRALHCDSCNGQGHESRDCPVRARDSCIFCSSTEHQRGVHCGAPHVYGRYVVCGTVDTFKRLPPHALACLRDSKASVQALRREVAALQAQNAALCAADAPRSGTAAESADSSAAALVTCEHEVARLQRALAAVEKHSTALLAADAERRSSAHSIQHTRLLRACVRA